MNEKIGIIAMFNLNSGGGAPRVTVDLVNSLNEIGRKVFLLTPFELDYGKIKDFYGDIKIAKVYTLEKWKGFFARGRAMPRNLLIKKFQEMAKEVDFIIDIDGGIFENYLPESFDNLKYIIWRISCVKPGLERPWIKYNFKRKIKEKILNFLGDIDCKPSNNHKIYPVDKWTAKELKEYWNIDSEKVFLYPEIKVDELLSREKVVKKNQIVVFGRIDPNKSIETSIEIFALGTKNFLEYKLIIMGGKTADTEEYLKVLNELITNFKISDRIEIIKNPPFEELKKILQESKIIIDSQKEINLTMTSIEAMAAGNVVLGYKNSGGFIDILDNGKFGYGFLTEKEGGEKLKEIIEKMNKGEININASIKRARSFGKNRFIKTLKEIIWEVNQK
ncbi:glycosyltransferase [Candidatus Pacearchaeota archaeon]|nr:glycosyltransferase [Candidatus Pacearchaeota archaeon]